MRVYTKIRVHINTGEVIEQEYCEYDGPVALAKGGSTSTTSIDYVYNERMADIAERQQEMADEYFEFWQEDYKEMEEMQVEANKYLIPSMVDVEKASYEQALRSMDPELIEREARHDVGIAFAQADDATRREMARMGIDPTSGKAMGALASTGLDKAKALAASMKDTLTLSKSSGDGFGAYYEGLQAEKAAAESETGAGGVGVPTPSTPSGTTPTTSKTLFGTPLGPTGYGISGSGEDYITWYQKNLEAQRKSNIGKANYDSSGMHSK